MKTLYLTDLDGTLLGADERVSARSAAIINRLLEQGVLLSFATARSLVSSARVTEGVRWRLPAVTSNGVTVQHPVTGQDYARTAFTPAEAAALRQSVQRHGLRPVVFSYLDGRERCSWLAGQETDGVREYLAQPVRKTDPRVRPVQDLDALFAGQISCVVCMGRREDFLQAHAEWSTGERYQCFFTRQLYSDTWWLEALPRQATKAAAALRLKELLGCSRIVFFGDGVNDLSLFRIADEAYATANAVPELKAAATAVIGSNEEDGVALWLAEHAQPAG